MAAFDKIKSGIPAMDAAFDAIRLGDNVVWQINSLDDFRVFCEPFARQALADGRNLVYIRFASHPPFFDPQPGLKIYHVALSHYFETFTVEIHDIIEKEGAEAFYVFDCLSELQVAWSTDLMMSNFFKVTCPFLFRLDTVAYFPILRGRHSFEAIARIRDTTQLLLDVYADARERYVHPLKVWQRYSPSMFLPHAYNTEDGSFVPLTDGIRISRFYAILEESSAGMDGQDLDSWDRFFAQARVESESGLLKPERALEMCRMMMTRDPRVQELILRYFSIQDFFSVRARMVGTGFIGGKACGMLAARKIMEHSLPQWKNHFEPHDSYYIGSDVFYTYCVQNGCWDLRIRQRSEAEYFSAAGQLAKALRHGVFPEDIRSKFRHMLEYYGQSPIIVRSSSIQEDGFGNAFAGKYESVFCINNGALGERLAAFEDAVRVVYASTMNPSALEYRKKRGLDRRDEQMAILVQRVSGSWFGDRFMPCAAGVGYSTSMYRIRPEMDVNAGMLRLVMGLGTRAVDRTEGDYPRLIALDAPALQLGKDSAERHRFSQHQIDVLDAQTGKLHTILLDALINDLPAHLKKALLSRDTGAEARFRERGEHRQIYYISCQGVAQNQGFTSLMSGILSALEEAYDYPVDIEFAVNLGEQEDFVLNLLQCRPLQLCESGGVCRIPKVPDAAAYFHLQDCAMGRTRMEAVDVLVTVDPVAYYHYDYVLKPDVARAIGAVNHFYKDQHKTMMLVVPGRIGTSSPELGVPVVFSDICEFQAICEVSCSEAGYMPELSYGSHMFQDLVEADMLYCAIYQNEKTLAYTPGLFASCPNLLSEILPQAKDLESILSVYDLSGQGLCLYHDMESGETLCARG